MNASANSLASEIAMPRDLLHHATVTAYDFLIAGQLESAVEISQGLVTMFPAHAYFRRLLGTALFRQRKFRAAFDVVEEGLKRVPDDKELLHVRRAAAKALGMK